MTVVYRTSLIPAQPARAQRSGVIALPLIRFAGSRPRVEARSVVVMLSPLALAVSALRGA
jgi:hypothetical protein